MRQDDEQHGEDHAKERHDGKFACRSTSLPALLTIAGHVSVVPRFFPSFIADDIANLTVEQLGSDNTIQLRLPAGLITNRESWLS